MATWAKGVDFKNSANTARVGGVGIYGTDGSAQKAYLGIGTEPWNKTGLEVTSSEVSFKGNKVYHAGSKPTPAEIGAAAASHNHTSLTGITNLSFATGSSDSGSITTTIDEANTYFDFNLSDDANADMWRWRFGAWDSSTSSTKTFNAMTLTATSATDAKLTVSGTVQASTFSGALSGNATTANTLTTARTINGTSFNGSSNITTANWGTARNIQIGNTSKSVNGSANVTWSLSEIGAAAASHTHSYLPLSGGTVSGTITVSGESIFHNGTYTDPWNGTACAIKTSGHVAVGGQIKATSTVTAPTFAGALSGNATTATKLQSARTIALGGILSGSASFDGSGNVTINATANDITTITKSLSVTTSWADTGITGSNLGSGTYAVQMYVNDGTNTSQYQEFYSGIMSWYSGTTNSGEADEILLHKAGHANNARHVYLRTIRTTGSGYLKLQISCTHAFTAASNIIFKFKKLI